MVKDFVLSSKVFHKRHHPKQNSFKYRSYYIILDMFELNENKANFLSINKPNLYSFYDKDHGLRDGSKSLKWATDLLDKHSLEYDNIKLMTMPRVLGYLFNHVSFWFCYSKKKLIAVCNC